MVSNSCRADTSITAGVYITGPTDLALTVVAESWNTSRSSLRLRDGTERDRVDRSLAAMGLTVLRTPVRAPQANAFCERLVGTIRRECLDFLVPLNERHLRDILRRWVAHYNHGRPTAA